jgi:hypothetical protein
MVVRHTWRLQKGVVVVDRRVINLHSLDVIVRGIIHIEHGGGYVRTILACIAFPSDINLTAVQVEGVEQILPKT